MNLLAVLDATMPNCVNRAAWAASLRPAMQRYGIDTDPDSVAVFLAQIAVESAEMNRLEENLRYSAARLTAVWPKRFPTLATAEPYAWNAQKLADLVYSNRMGNGTPESGEGWRYRGRGLKMLTGRDNYAECGKALKIPLLHCPDMLLTKQWAAESACWFWSSRPQDLDMLADDRPDDDDEADFKTITRVINGGTTGLEARRGYWKKARRALGLTTEGQ